MRGDLPIQPRMFATVVLEDRIPTDHPLRAIRGLVDPILRELSPRFEALYSRIGRPSVPPECLLRAMLLQVLYTIRSERQLVEQLEYNLLFRWFVGLDLEAPAWHATTFTKNRQRLLDGDIARVFLGAVVARADVQALLSREHFTVDGTLLEAFASHKSVRPKDTDDDSPIDPGNDGVTWHGEPRSNATHQSVTDPDARLARKSHNTGAILGYQATVLVENRHGLILDAVVGHVSGTAEVEHACYLLASQPPTAQPRTIGADKGFDTRTFVDTARDLGYTPHVARKTRYSAVDGRTTRHDGYAISQRRRKIVEEVFGWAKTVGLLKKLRHRGLATVDWVVTFTLACYNLVRLRTLTAGPAPA
jgi:transposase